MFSDFFNSSIFHHLFGGSKIFFVLSFHNYCLPLVILNNSVCVVKFFNRSLGVIFTFLPDTVFIVHITNSFFPYWICIWCLLIVYSLQFLCSGFVLKSFINISTFLWYTHLQTSWDCLCTGITQRGLNSKILPMGFSGYSSKYFLWTSEMSSGKSRFLFYLCTVFISGWKDVSFTWHHSRNRIFLIKADIKVNGLLRYCLMLFFVLCLDLVIL